ncbi:hypothetical protein ACMTN4_27750 [Rhodococcus globerulus]
MLSSVRQTSRRAALPESERSDFFRRQVDEAVTVAPLANFAIMAGISSVLVFVIPPEQHLIRWVGAVAILLVFLNSTYTWVSLRQKRAQRSVRRD